MHGCAPRFRLDYEENSRIEAERNWYVRHPDYLNRVFTRAQRYLPFILEELERRDLPMELALLPIVESAYDPFAYSHGRAAGLWQMIPGTDTPLRCETELVVRTAAATSSIRRAPRSTISSTCMNLTTATGSMRSPPTTRAKAMYGAPCAATGPLANRSTSGTCAYPRETSSYVPKLLALVDIVNDPAKYDLVLPTVSEEPQFVVQDIDTQLDLALAAELAGVHVDTIYAYNPGYNQWATDPAGPHSLVLPIDVAETFAAALDTVPSGERVRWKRHKIGNGETISEIAEDYNTTPSSIRAANNLRGNTIRAGQYLMIPVSTKPLAAYSQSADARLARTQNRQRSGNKVEHIVRSGESFWTISQRYKVTHRQLAAWNGMAPGDTLSVGKKLVVWTNTNASGPSVSPVSAHGSTTRQGQLHGPQR